MTPQRAYEILVSAANYCMVFMDGWDAFDEIILARRNVIEAAGELPLSDDDSESFSSSNLLRWQYIRRINGYGEVKAIESEAA
jgi:hypothetical protein